MPEQEYSISRAELGARLKHKRVVERLTQQQAAEAASMARTTLVAIEQGKRHIRIDELQQLARAYSTSANWLLARDATQVRLFPQFRKCYGCSKGEQDKAGSLLAKLVEAELVFENLLGLENRRDCPVVKFLGHDCQGEIVAAEKDADTLRKSLKMGIAPIQNMPQLIEFGLNMRLYMMPIHSGISGMWASSDHGECVLLNSNHPPERKNFSAAHELGHFVWSVKVKNKNMHSSRSTEKYANHFAGSFLMPEEAIVDQVKRLEKEASLTMRSLVLLSSIFNVSVQAMALRLEGLKIARGLSDIIKEQGGIGQRQKTEVLSEADIHRGKQQYKLQRIYRLAAAISEKALLSEGQLSKLLCLNRLKLRTILQQYDARNAGSC